MNTPLRVLPVLRAAVAASVLCPAAPRPPKKRRKMSKRCQEGRETGRVDREGRR